MNRKPFLIVVLLSLVAFQTVIVRVRAETTISQGTVYSGSVSPDETEAYQLSENLSKNSLVILSVKVISGGGNFTLFRGSKIAGEYSVYADVYTPFPLGPRFYPFILPENGTGYVFNVTSNYGASFEFSFFYDIPEVLSSQNTRSILLDTAAVGYYVDMDRGDKLSLKLAAPENAEFDLIAMPMSYVLVSSQFIPPTFNTFFAPSPKSLEFTTDFKARYMIFVVSTSGTGNFTLLSSHTGNPVEGSIEFLRSRIDMLNNLIDNLILICVVSAFLAAGNLFMYLRLRKSMKQNVVAPGESETQQSKH